MKIYYKVFVLVFSITFWSCGNSEEHVVDVGYEEFQNEKAPKDIANPKDNSDVHQKYLNKVLLSYTPIVYGRENENEILDNIVIDDISKGLYFLYYLENTNAEYLGKNGQYVRAQLQFDSDVGKSMGNGCFVLWWKKAYDLTDEEEQQNYLSLPIFPSNDYYKTDQWLDPIYNKFLSCLTKLSVNKPHNGRIVFGFPMSRNILEKKFTITITDKGKEAMLRMMNRIHYEKVKRVRMDKEGDMHNSENIKIVEAAAEKKGYNVKRIVITGDKYNIYKNTKYPNSINNKACNAQLVYEENGKCYLLDFQIVKEYQGGGTYGKAFIPFKRGEKEEILCRNASK
ncbi:MAG: hypothetical protein R2785_02950 [Flavobacteriaceae bacterium]